MIAVALLYTKLISCTAYPAKAFKFSNIRLLNFHTYRTIARQPARYKGIDIRGTIIIKGTSTLVQLLRTISQKDQM